MAENMDTKFSKEMTGHTGDKTNNPPLNAPGYPYPATSVPFIPGQDLPPEGASLQLMPLISSIPECPPGLEYLTRIDQLILYPTERNVAIINYQIKDSSGQQIYLANGEYQFITTGETSISIHVINNNRQEVMRVLGSAKIKCTLCLLCCPGAEGDLAIESPAGQVIGRVAARESTCYINDANSAPVLKYTYPSMKSGDPHPERVYGLTAHDGSVVGRVIEQWSGILRVPKYKIEFPMDMHVKTKATVLVSAILLNSVTVTHTTLTYRD